MIREMEDTLVEIKAFCAGVMANKKRIQRQLEDSLDHTKSWEQKAGLAVSKGREDLAREALLEKRRYAERVRSLEHELEEVNGLVGHYQEDIRQLEDKLQGAREKQRMLIQRHIHANKKRRAQQEIRRMESSEAVVKFEEFENRIERMEAEADLVNYGRKPSLEVEFEELMVDEEIENELQALKTTMKQGAKSE
jgi:phage shock protein A